ncbi:hypothetical protein IAU60_006829 [Kwoniella sp. DSM 27419]
MPGHALEYEEEDVFGSGGEGDDFDNGFDAPTQAMASGSSSRLPLVNPAVPIPLGKASTSAPPTSKGKERAKDTAVSTGKVYMNVESRLRELQETKRAAREHEYAEFGVRSLKVVSMGAPVVRANAARIWDVGDMEYQLIKPFVDDLPVEQLAEIEAASPHIKKDTDWLWEIFLLQDFPLFHERCQDRRGERRTSGWRKMYRKAKEDQVHRQSQAVDRVAARYKQLEEEKAAKRIVLMDKIMPDKRPVKSGWGRSAGGGGGSWGSGSAGGAGGGGGGSASKPQNAIAKARLEAQRARVALTHASGRYIPPPPGRTGKPRGETELFKNPYLRGMGADLPRAGGHSTALPALPRPVEGPRIPARRRGGIPGRPNPGDMALARQPPTTAPPTSSSSRFASSNPSSPRSARTSPIPGSYPTSQAAQVRASLPAHLASNTDARGRVESQVGSTERFRINGPVSKYREIRKPQSAKFETPKLDMEDRVKGRVVDFFATPMGPRLTAASPGQAATRGDGSVDPRTGTKRKDMEEGGTGDWRSDESRKRAGLVGGSATPEPENKPSPGAVAVPAASPYRSASATPISVDQSKRLSSVLFRKKKAPR